MNPTIRPDPVIADFLDRIERLPPLTAWVLKADAAHAVWMQGLPDHDRRRIEAAFEARFAACEQP